MHLFASQRLPATQDAGGCRRAGAEGCRRVLWPALLTRAPRPSPHSCAQQPEDRQRRGRRGRRRQRLWRLPRRLRRRLRGLWQRLPRGRRRLRRGLPRGRRRWLRGRRRRRRELRWEQPEQQQQVRGQRRRRLVARADYPDLHEHVAQADRGVEEGSHSPAGRALARPLPRALPEPLSLTFASWVSAAVPIRSALAGEAGGYPQAAHLSSEGAGWRLESPPDRSARRLHSAGPAPGPGDTRGPSLALEKKSL